MKTCRQYQITVFRTEPHTPRQNKAERVIGEIRRRWRSRMAHRAVPLRLWDFGQSFSHRIEQSSRKNQYIAVRRQHSIIRNLYLRS
jgi:hypothetical protein